MVRTRVTRRHPIRFASQFLFYYTTTGSTASTTASTTTSKVAKVSKTPRRRARLTAAIVRRAPIVPPVPIIPTATAASKGKGKAPLVVTKHTNSAPKNNSAAFKAAFTPLPPRPSVAKPADAAPAAPFAAWGGNMSQDYEEGMFRYAPKLQENSPEPNLEICFSFDTTGSMSSYVNQVKEQVSNIVRQLLGDLPGIRISIIAHGDYCDYKNYVIQKLDLSNDVDAIPLFINHVTSTSGGDGDECYELVLQEAQTLSWSPASAKALVMIGDAAPHQPHQYRKIDWTVELDKLNAQGVKVYGVRCGSSRESFYEKIAQVTGGATLELSDIKGISELMMGLCYREAAAEHGRRRDAMEAAAASTSTSSAAAAAVVDGDDAPAKSKGRGRNRKGKAKSSAEDEEDAMEVDGEEGGVMRGPEPSEEEKATGGAKFDEEAAWAIHRAIHSTKKTVKVHGKTHEISIGYAGCRFVKIGDETYIEQNKDKSSSYAKMAVAGRKITWIIRKGKWGLIMDDNRKIEQTDAREDA